MTTHTLRRYGMLGTAGGTLTVISGVLVRALVQPASDVSDEMFSYPWTSGALVPVSLLFAFFHALVFVGILGWARSGVAGDGRGARIGTALALAGTVALFLAELLSIPVAGQRMDDTGAGLVGAGFGVAMLLSAIGFIVAGVTTLRAARWEGWRRSVPLVTGLWLTVLLFLAATPALAAGVAVYGVLLTALGVALWTQPAPDSLEVSLGRVRVRR